MELPLIFLGQLIFNVISGLDEVGLGCWLADLVFYFVDVFAEEKFAGNQLAVILNGADLSSEQMQRIANEMHFSETTFIQSNIPRKASYDVRIFTPFAEVPFAGHPTLGTAYVIKHFVAKHDLDYLTLNLKIGQIPVAFEKNSLGEEIVWMKQKPAAFGNTFSIKQLASVLQLPEDAFDDRYPIQEVSTGMPFIIVALKTLDAVKKAYVNFNTLQEMASGVHGGILIFASETYNKANDLNVRVFVDLFGIPEDPATGSGNGCLAAYLSQYQYFGTQTVNVRVEQGCELKRPSLLLLRAQPTQREIQIQVGGKVIPIAHGKLL